MTVFAEPAAVVCAPVPFAFSEMANAAFRSSEAQALSAAMQDRLLRVLLADGFQAIAGVPGVVSTTVGYGGSDQPWDVLISGALQVTDPLSGLSFPVGHQLLLMSVPTRVLLYIEAWMPQSSAPGSSRISIKSLVHSWEVGGEGAGGDLPGDVRRKLAEMAGSALPKEVANGAWLSDKISLELAP